MKGGVFGIGGHAAASVARIVIPKFIVRDWYYLGLGLSDMLLFVGESHLHLVHLLFLDRLF